MASVQFPKRTRCSRAPILTIGKATFNVSTGREIHNLQTGLISHDNLYENLERHTDLKFHVNEGKVFQTILESDETDRDQNMKFDRREEVEVKSGFIEDIKNKLGLIGTIAAGTVTILFLLVIIVLLLKMARCLTKRRGRRRRRVTAENEDPPFVVYDTRLGSVQMERRLNRQLSRRNAY